MDDLSALWLYNAGTTSGTTFNPATDTITVTGAGFNAATLGLIHIEDGAGGQDDNGLTMLPAFVSSTMLTAVLNTAGTNGGFGDGAPFTNSTTSTPGPIILYYEDSNSITSNNLLGTVDGGSNVTMAQ